MSQSKRRRSTADLARALRERATFVKGASWEVPATVAMMREAADALDRQPSEGAHGRRAALSAIERVIAYIKGAMKPQSIAEAASETTWDRGRRSGLREALNSIDHEFALPASSEGAHGWQDECQWTPSDTCDAEYWESACGETWSFIDGGPAENRVRFCHGCGKPIAFLTPSTPEDQ